MMMKDAAKSDELRYNVNSEVGNLEAVLLHRPGKELERLTPLYLEELLFEDIPWLVKMQEEHDKFASVLRERGCRVLYYDRLLAEVLENEQARSELITETASLSGITRLKEQEAVLEYLRSRNAAELAEIFIAGLPKSDIHNKRENRSLSYYITEDYPFYINPLPNLYFTRDPGAVIGRGISINSMKTPARRRETAILSYINRFHPLLKGSEAPLWYSPEYASALEGGDVLALSSSVVAVGCSARTSPEGIEKLAENLFQSDSGIRQVLVIQIPFNRAYMHLDTVFTMLDVNKFILYPGIADGLKIFSIRPGVGDSLNIEPEKDLKQALAGALDRSNITILHSGGSDRITAAREQWNDSTNTLAVAPGVVVTYRRNQASNSTLRENGVEVLEIDGSELVRGRGGPRCMSMPLRRSALD